MSDWSKQEGSAEAQAILKAMRKQVVSAAFDRQVFVATVPDGEGLKPLVFVERKDA